MLRGTLLSFVVFLLASGAFVSASGNASPTLTLCGVVLDAPKASGKMEMAFDFFDPETRQLVHRAVAMVNYLNGGYVATVATGELRPGTYVVSASAPGSPPQSPDAAPNSYVRLQPDTPGTQQVGHVNISGSLLSSMVGIGTATPGFPLTFSDAFGDKISLLGQTGDHFGLGVQSGLLQIHSIDMASDIAFGYGRSEAFTELMRIKGTGDVGIGTLTPAARLDVAGTARMTGFQLTTGATEGHVLTADSLGIGTWRAPHWDDTGADIFNTNAGNVGIGTSAPGEKLTVAGIVHSTTGGVRFPDGSLQMTAAVSGQGVPSGYMILGATTVSPAGYTYTGSVMHTVPAWVFRADMAVARSYFGTAAVGNKVYAAGGNTLTTLEEYDPVTDTWTPKASMPTGRSFLAAAEIGGKFYAVGGYSGGVLSTLEEYDPATNTWTPRAGMPTARSALAAAALNGKLYAIGGSNGSVALATVEEYDPTTNAWTTKAPLQYARYSLTAVAANGKVYAIGGFSNALGGDTAIVEEFNPVANTWALRNQLATRRTGLASAALGTKIYAIGGYDTSTNTYHATVEEYDVAGTMPWRQVASLREARFQHGAAVAGGKIFAMGGFGPPGSRRSTEMFVQEALLYVHQKN